MDDWDRQKLRERQRAISAAVHIIGWPLGLLFLVMAYCHWIAFREGIKITDLAIALGVVVGLSILAGTAIGVTVNWLFPESSISAKQISVAIGLLVDLTVIGWLIVESHKSQ